MSLTKNQALKDLKQEMAHLYFIIHVYSNGEDIWRLENHCDPPLQQQSVSNEKAVYTNDQPM